MRRPLACVIVLLALAASGCGENVSTPTSASSASSTVVTRLFTGTLMRAETQFYSFTITQDSGVDLMLASLARPGDRAPGNGRIDLALGVPRGTGCQVITSVRTEAALTPQIREWRTRGVHCVSVSDPGTLAGSATFAVRISYYQ